MILMPIIAQSSDEASLTITARFALGVVDVLPSAELPELPDPPPHAASSAAATPSDNTRDEFDIVTIFMFDGAVVATCGAAPSMTKPTGEVWGR
jgi:hypothetical protein